MEIIFNKYNPTLINLDLPLGEEYELVKQHFDYDDKNSTNCLVGTKPIK